MPAIFYVNSTGDLGDSNRNDNTAWTGNMIAVGGQMVQEVTLRAAIEQANWLPSTAQLPHIISFIPRNVIGVNDDEGVPPAPPPPTPQTIVLTAPIEDIRCYLQVTGSGRDLLTITRDTTAAGFRFFSVATTPNTTCAVGFKDMTIRDSGYVTGLLGGAFLVGTAPSTASLTLENVTLSNNQAKSGGAVYVSNGSELVLKNCLIDQNEAAGAGNEGGAVCITGSGQMRAYNSTLSNNKAIGSKGGAICLNASAQVVLTDTDLVANQGAEGGAVYASVGNVNLTPVKMYGGIVACNTSTKWGGAFFLSTTNALFNDVAFSGNSSVRGGAIYVKERKVELFGCSFDQNTATVLGPKIAYDGELFANPTVWIYLTDCTGITAEDRVRDV